jgi:hypothetical protein
VNPNVGLRGSSRASRQKLPPSRQASGGARSRPPSLLPQLCDFPSAIACPYVHRCLCVRGGYCHPVTSCHGYSALCIFFHLALSFFSFPFLPSPFIQSMHSLTHLLIHAFLPLLPLLLLLLLLIERASSYPASQPASPLEICHLPCLPRSRSLPVLEQSNHSCTSELSGSLFACATNMS